MSDSTASLRRQIRSAGDLQSVVRTMKTLAASSIGQYEQAVRALGDYARTVELGLSVCFRGSGADAALTGTLVEPDSGRNTSRIGGIVFGSDQGLVGQFNDVVADYAVRALAALTDRPLVWAVGERVHARLTDAGLPVVGRFAVPGSVAAITPLIGQILVASEVRGKRVAQLDLYYNRPASGAGYAPVNQRLLPLDDAWQGQGNRIKNL